MKKSIAGIVYENGKFLIGRRLNSGEMAGRWEFPGGKVDSGESIEQTIIREFNEEMGVSVVPGKLISSVVFKNKNGPVTLYAYRVFFPSDYTITLTEHTKVEWATLKEIEALNFVDSDRLLFPAIKIWCNNDPNC
ncbi:MAG TPA: (deoxy)nucleoside triphosphate pyrophosphohydrolase [Treponema sp.]|nr:(deoxy)nucleoside triphosphate pyrophosphohydrolase [Treponema sp.]